MHPLTYLGLLFIMIGTGLTLYGQQIINDRSNESLQNKTDKITELSQENIRLSSELNKINQEIAGTVTGGESFCYLFPSPSFGNINTLDFHLKHKGEYPVYDVSIRVWDETCLNRIDHGQIFEKHLGYRNKSMPEEEWKKMQDDPKFTIQNANLQKEIKEQMQKCLIVNEKVGTVTSSPSTNIMDPILFNYTVPRGVDPSKYSQEYSVNIRSRNGQINQKIKFNIRDKRYHVYSKVEKTISNSKSIVVREYESQDSEGFAIKFIK